MCMCANSGQKLKGVNEKKKKRKADSNLYKRKECCVKTIHVRVQQKQNCVHEKYIDIWKLFLTVTERKSITNEYLRHYSSYKNTKSSM